MTDLPFDFSETLEAFTCPETIIAYDKVGSYVNGYWTETVGNRRMVSCILLNLDEKKLEIIAEGRHVESAYCMMFDADEEKMFINHQQDNTIQNKQTYVLIDGFEYVVVNNPETEKNAGFLSYYALRYKSSENVPLPEETGS